MKIIRGAIRNLVVVTVAVVAFVVVTTVGPLVQWRRASWNAFWDGDYGPERKNVEVVNRTLERQSGRAVDACTLRMTLEGAPYKEHEGELAQEDLPVWKQLLKPLAGDTRGGNKRDAVVAVTPDHESGTVTTTFEMDSGDDMQIVAAFLVQDRAKRGDEVDRQYPLELAEGDSIIHGDSDIKTVQTSEGIVTGPARLVLAVGNNHRDGNAGYDEIRVPIWLDVDGGRIAGARCRPDAITAKWIGSQTYEGLNSSPAYIYFPDKYRPPSLRTQASGSGIGKDGRRAVDDPVRAPGERRTTVATGDFGSVTVPTRQWEAATGDTATTVVSSSGGGSSSNDAASLAPVLDLQRAPF